MEGETTDIPTSQSADHTEKPSSEDVNTESKIIIVKKVEHKHSLSSMTDDASDTSDVQTINCDDQPQRDRKSDTISPPDINPMEVLKSSEFMDQSIPINDLIERTNYLQQYPSWLSFFGPEHKKKFTPTAIKRNDNIWEFMSTERNYLQLLLMISEVYMVPFPEVDQSQIAIHFADDLSCADLRSVLFPGISELITIHERLLRPLLAVHSQRQDHVVESLGPLLVHLLEAKYEIAQLYGSIMHAQRFIRKRLQACKKIPSIATFLQQAQANPRCLRKSIDDCFMVVVQRWTKVLTLLEVIIRNTPNDEHEVKCLEQAKSAVNLILKSAESQMTCMEHKEKLLEFANNLEVPPNGTDETELLQRMRNEQTKLINYGPLSVQLVGKGGGHHGNQMMQVEGVALTNGFFMLRKNSESKRYHLVKDFLIPAVLWWGNIFGYFRKSGEKGQFGFYVILQSSNSLILFRCDTVDEFARWETIFNEGFAQWREPGTPHESLSDSFHKNLNEIDQQYKRTEAVLELFRDLNATRFREWEGHNFVCSVLISERLAQLGVHVNSGVEVKKENGADTSRKHKKSLSRNCRSNSDTNSSIESGQSIAAPISEISNILRKNTFICNFETHQDVQEAFAMFRELFYRLSFALLGGSCSTLSRSASDVDDRKRPQANSVKKHDTFTSHDSSKGPKSLRSSIDSGHKANSKRNDAHRLSSTMISIFRASSRDKNHRPTDTKSPVDSTVGSASNSNNNCTQSFQQQQALSKSSKNCSATSVPGGNLLAQPRPSFSISNHTSLGLVNATAVSDQMNSLMDNSAYDSSSSLANLPSADSLLILKELSSIAEKLFTKVQSIITENVELRASVKHLETLKDNWEQFDKQAAEILSQPNTIGSSADGVDSSTVKQETEKLRKDYENFRHKCQEWEKDYVRQRAELEREHNGIAKERQKLDDERSDLDRCYRQYEALRKTLQSQLDLYKSRGMQFNALGLEELELLANCNTDTTSLYMKNRRSTVTGNDVNTVLLERSSTTTSSPISDLAQLNDMLNPDTYSQPVINLSDRKPSTPLTPSVYNAELPEHLRGSLLNQPTTSKPTVTNSSSISPSVSSKDPLMKIAVTKKRTGHKLSFRPRSSYKQT